MQLGHGRGKRFEDDACVGDRPAGLLQPGRAIHGQPLGEHRQLGIDLDNAVTFRLDRSGHVRIRTVCLPCLHDGVGDSVHHR